MKKPKSRAIDRKVGAKVLHGSGFRNLEVKTSELGLDERTLEEKSHSPPSKRKRNQMLPPTIPMATKDGVIQIDESEEPVEGLSGVCPWSFPKDAEGLTATVTGFFQNRSEGHSQLAALKLEKRVLVHKNTEAEKGKIEA